MAECTLSRYYYSLCTAVSLDIEVFVRLVAALFGSDGVRCSAAPCFCPSENTHTCSHPIIVFLFAPCVLKRYLKIMNLLPN